MEGIDHTCSSFLATHFLCNELRYSRTTKNGLLTFSVWRALKFSLGNKRLQHKTIDALASPYAASFSLNEDDCPYPPTTGGTGCSPNGRLYPYPNPQSWPSANKRQAARPCRPYKRTLQTSSSPSAKHTTLRTHGCGASTPKTHTSGFSSCPSGPGRMALHSTWGFMISRRYLGMGFGSRATQLAIEHVKTNYPQAKLGRLGRWGADFSDELSTLLNVSLRGTRGFGMGKGRL